MSIDVSGEPDRTVGDAILPKNTVYVRHATVSLLHFVLR